MSYSPRDASGNYLLIENVQTDNYTLTLDDAGKLVTLLVSADKSVTIPPNADVPFPIGTQVIIHRGGNGPVFVLAGSGVTLKSARSLIAISDKYATAALVKRDTDSWLLAGSLS